MSRNLVCVSVSGQRLLADESGQQAGADCKGPLIEFKCYFVSNI